MQDVTSIEVDGVTYYNHKGETWDEVCGSSLGERDRLNHKTLPGERHAKTFAQFVNNIWYKVVHFKGELIRMDNVKVRFYYFDTDGKPIEICARPPVSLCNILSQDFEHAKKKPLYYTENEQTPSTCSMQGGKSKGKSNRKRQQRRTKRRQQKSKRRQRK